MIYERHISKYVEINKANIGFISEILSELKIFFMDRLAGNYDKFILLTEGNKNEWKNRNTIVIPNPLTFYPKSSSNLINKKVIAVGKHSYQKGYDLLIEIWKIVVQKHKQWRLEIYGQIDPNIVAKAHKHKIGDSIDFFPPVENIQEKYLDSSIFVFPSRFEGFGMVLIEAMACGLPCISFDCPHGPRDIIKNNEDGFIIKNGDIYAFANKIILLIENKSLRIKMGSIAKENVRRYSLENIMSKWDKVFQSYKKNT